MEMQEYRKQTLKDKDNPNLRNNEKKMAQDTSIRKQIQKA